MGEAIARFRDLAIAVRRECDELASQPRVAVQAEAAAKFATACGDLLLFHEAAGMPYPRRYVTGLFKQRDIAERQPLGRKTGHLDVVIPIQWLPEPFSKQKPHPSDFREARRKAVKQAVHWGSLFTEAETRLKDLEQAAYQLTQCEADDEYIELHEQFAEALDALAPFIEEPPALAATSEKKPGEKQKKRRDRKGVGGRPNNFPKAFYREVVAARVRDEKHAAKARQPLLSISEWLSEYFTNVKKLPLSTVPSKDPKKPEEWNIRARRFWKAAKASLSRPGN
jgi:hypothetical protein